MTATNVMSLISRTHLTWKRHLQAGLVGQGITLKQLFVLRRLAKARFLHPAEIAEMLFCDRPTAAVVLRNMEKRGWILCEPDPDSRRRVLVRITPQGRRKLRAVMNSAKSQRTGAFDPMACFRPAQTARLETLLRTLLEHLGAL
jgi:DNA-binding MarR family transcriptional regulator